MADKLKATDRKRGRPSRFHQLEEEINKNLKSKRLNTLSSMFGNELDVQDINDFTVPTMPVNVPKTTEPQQTPAEIKLTHTIPTTSVSSAHQSTYFDSYSDMMSDNGCTQSIWQKKLKLS